MVVAETTLCDLHDLAQLIHGLTERPMLFTTYCLHITLLCVLTNAYVLFMLRAHIINYIIALFQKQIILSTHFHKSKMNFKNYSRRSALHKVTIIIQHKRLFPRITQAINTSKCIQKPIKKFVERRQCFRKHIDLSGPYIASHKNYDRFGP